jgi:hypothetical protein
VAKIGPPNPPTAWEDAGTTASSLAPWATAPAIAWDGARMRVFVAQTGFPGWVYQTIHEGVSWGAWRQVSSQGIATRQPAASSVNGTMNLATSWFTSGIQEQALE